LLCNDNILSRPDGGIYDPTDELFLKKIICNNMEYISNNYMNISKSEIIYNVSILSVGFANVQMIKFIFEKFKININSPQDSFSSSPGVHYLYTACFYNKELSVIKYLIEDLKIDINYSDTAGNYLTSASSNNKNLKIIKYLAEECKLDPNICDQSGRDCFLNACNNKNPEIVKYLVGNYQIDFSVKDVDGYDSIDIAAFNYDNDSAILLYLIEETAAPLQLRKFSSDRYEEIVLKITKNIARLSEMLSLGSGRRSKARNFGKEFMIGIIKKINPLLLEESWLKYADIQSPYDDTFDQFIKYVNDLKWVVPVSFNNKPISRINKRYTFNRPSDILFTSNGSIYYGDRLIVYGSMNLFKDILEMINFQDPIELDSMIPGYIVNLYIQSCYTNQFDLYEIELNDFIKFIEFIDQYPTDVLSIDLLEDAIAQYIDNDIIKNDGTDDLHLKTLDQIKKIIIKYKLKKLYLYYHNKMVI